MPQAGMLGSLEAGKQVRGVQAESRKLKRRGYKAWRRGGWDVGAGVLGLFFKVIIYKFSRS